ncbi:MAG TPA: hypothetical protein VM680_04810 [Verrucomicrobiae bacterium]|nr:hypothetical protein [Verrucomicrobiae bacterium]
MTSNTIHTLPLCIVLTLALTGCDRAPESTPPAPTGSSPSQAVPQVSSLHSIKVTTDDVLHIRTSNTEVRLQVLAVNETLRSRTNPGMSLTYKMRFAANASPSSTVTNTVQQTFAVEADPDMAGMMETIRKTARSLGATNTESMQLLKPTPSQSPIRVGDANLQWSYATSNSVWIKYDTNTVTITILPNDEFVR